MQLVIIESPFAGGENIEIDMVKEDFGGFTACFDKCPKPFSMGPYTVPSVGKKHAKRHAALMYARAAMNDCFKRGEAPIASHLLYTQPGVLDDDIPEERKKGIEAGLLWGRHASKTVVYIDLGISDGMKEGIERAKAQGRPIEQRQLPGWS